MKKQITLIVILALALAACGGSNASSSTSAEPQSASITPSSTPRESADDKPDDATVENTIAVKDATRGYNGGLEEAFVQINFGHASFADVDLMGIRDMDARRRLDFPPQAILRYSRFRRLETGSPLLSMAPRRPMVIFQTSLT